MTSSTRALAAVQLGAALLGALAVECAAHRATAPDADPRPLHLPVRVGAGDYAVTQEQRERFGLTVAKYACLTPLVVGVIHALIVLISGVYDFQEYGFRGRITGWNARVGAAGELVLFVWLAFAMYRSQIFKSPGHDDHPEQSRL